MLMHVGVPAWEPPGFTQWREKEKKGVTHILPFSQISELKSFIIIFSSLPANVVHWCVIEGRVHAQNDELGHSRVNTRTGKHQQIFQRPDHWTGEACQSQRCLCWYDYSRRTLTKCCWRPCDHVENVTGGNTAQIAQEIKMTCWIQVLMLLFRGTIYFFSSVQTLMSLSFWLPQSHLVTCCLLAVIICHSNIGPRLWQDTFVSFHLPKQDQYAACYEGDKVIGGHGVWSGLLRGLVIDFRFSVIPAARRARNADHRSCECVEKSGDIRKQCVEHFSCS